MTAQMGIDPVRWAEAVASERPEIHRFILDVVREHPPPPIPETLRDDPREAIRTILHHPSPA